jgi:hypothetical protein
MATKPPNWLQWAQRLQAISQNGLTYAKDPFDLERFNQVRQIAAEILSASDDPDVTDSIVDLFKRNFGYPTPRSTSAPPSSTTIASCSSKSVTMEVLFATVAVF